VPGVSRRARVQMPGGRRPIPRRHAVDVAQLVAAEGRQDVGVEVRPVSGERLRLEMCLGSKPALSPLLGRDLRQAWVGPVAADEVGLDGDHESIGVDPTDEAPRPFPTSQVAIADPPGFAAIGSFLDVGHAVDPSSMIGLVGLIRGCDGTLSFECPSVAIDPVFPAQVPIPCALSGDRNGVWRFALKGCSTLCGKGQGVFWRLWSQ
jgi:hypothetical protein